MATDTRDIAEPAIDPAADSFDPTKDWYDRSSLVGDFMVMIADQSEGEYLRRAPETRSCELIDGVVYMPSPVNGWHQIDCTFLTFLLQGFACGRDFGPILPGPAALLLRPDCYLEPDLFILPPGGEGQIQGAYSVLPAIFVVEFLSRSTRSHDLKRKAALYREAEIPEIWFVDSRDRVLIVHRKFGDAYEVVTIASGPYSSTAIPGFWINVDWLWTERRPNLMTCLQAILAGPPA